VPCIEKCGNLLLPGCAVQGIAVNEDNGVARAVVLVIELDVI
jgi:hypothetical protein